MNLLLFFVNVWDASVPTIVKVVFYPHLLKISRIEHHLMMIDFFPLEPLYTIRLPVVALFIKTSLKPVKMRTVGRGQTAATVPATAGGCA